MHCIWQDSFSALFSIFLDPYKQSQKGRVFSKSITFNTLKNKRFWHVTNCLIAKTEKKLHNLHWTKIKWSLYRCQHVCFSQSLVRARVFTSAVGISIPLTVIARGLWERDCTNRRARTNWYSDCSWVSVTVEVSLWDDFIFEQARGYSCAFLCGILLIKEILTLI